MFVFQNGRSVLCPTYKYNLLTNRGVRTNNSEFLGTDTVPKQHFENITWATSLCTRSETNGTEDWKAHPDTDYNTTCKRCATKIVLDISYTLFKSQEFNLSVFNTMLAVYLDDTDVFSKHLLTMNKNQQEFHIQCRWQTLGFDKIHSITCTCKFPGFDLWGSIKAKSWDTPGCVWIHWKIYTMLLVLLSISIQNP